MFGLTSFLFVGIAVASAEIVKPVPTLMAVPVKATGTVPVVNPNQNNPQGSTLRDKYNKQLRGLKNQYTGAVATTVKAKVGEVKERLAARHKERIRPSVEKMIDRYYPAVARIGSAKERIQAHIQKMEEKGIDLSEAKALLPVVDEYINTALDQIAQVKEEVETMIDSDNPRSVWQEVKILIASAKGSVRSAHKALRDVIIKIKASVKVDSETSSSDSGDGNDDEDGSDDDQATTTEETQ